MILVKLNISERIALLGVLPPVGDIVTLRIIQELRTSLSFTEEEMEKWKIKNKKVEGGAIITWDEDFTDKTKDFDIGKAVTGVIKQELLKLSAQKQLRVDMIPLYEKFVEATDKTEEIA